MFGIMLLIGDLGCLMLWAVVWFPIAANLKMHYSFTSPRLYTVMKKQVIAVGDGGAIVVSNHDDGASDLTVGMSMGEG